MIRLGDTVPVVVEAPRGSFVKRADDGTVDYVAPLPCPFNYGSVPGTVAGDGDPADVILLGARRARGARCSARVVGIVDFVDDGRPDPKHVCAVDRASALDRFVVQAFFGCFTWAKRTLNRARGKHGRTACDGIRFESPEREGAGAEHVR